MALYFQHKVLNAFSRYCSFTPRWRFPHQTTSTSICVPHVITTLPYVSVFCLRACSSAYKSEMNAFSLKESNTPFQDDYPPLSDYEPPSAKSGEEDDVYLIRAQGLPYSCTEEDVLNFFAGNFISLNGSSEGL